MALALPSLILTAASGKVMILFPGMIESKFLVSVHFSAFGVSSLVTEHKSGFLGSFMEGFLENTFFSGGMSISV